jgi:cyclic 2,3-diphosphoglycerate synthase
MPAATVIPAIALVDGEHYPEVTLDALESIESSGYRLVALVFLGGTEKMKEGATLDFKGVPVFSGPSAGDSLREAAGATEAKIVFDLSDDPVLSYEKRFSLISVALALGLDYEGADFSFRAPPRPHSIHKPVIGVWGTGKRVGKTGLCAFAARRIASGGEDVCILTMGRGGPRKPEVIMSPGLVTDEYLRDRASAGLHAASDHFEDAMFARVATVGCRRAGGGMAGRPFYSNVAEGAALVDGLDCDIVLCEGSGAAIPPVGTDAVILVASAQQPESVLLSYLGPYRLLQTDLLVVTMVEDFLESSDKLRKLIDGVQSINPGVMVVKTVFRPQPFADIEGREVFLTSTASDEAVVIQARYLEDSCGARVMGYSGALADRGALETDLERALGAEVIATELKAAGVDTVSAFAKANGIELVYLENVPVPIDGDLDGLIDRLARMARERHGGQ